MRKQNPSDPTDERTSEHSTQVASGLGGGQGGPEKAGERDVDDVLNRSAEERYETPRRYEEGERPGPNPNSGASRE